MTDIGVLSKMERKVLEVSMEGLGRTGVAKKLNRSKNTISTHLARIQRKLKARSPMHAILIFARQRWLEELGDRR